MTALSPDLYARLLVRLATRRSADVEAVLGELGLSFEDLERGEAALVAELRDSYVKRKGIAAMKFAAALGAELGERGPLHAKAANRPPPAPVQAAPPPLAYMSAPVPPADLSVTRSPWAAAAWSPAPAPVPPAPAAPTLPEPVPPTLDTDDRGRRPPVPAAPLPFDPARPALLPGPDAPRSARGGPRRAKRHGLTEAMPVWSPDGQPRSTPFAGNGKSRAVADPEDLRRMPLDLYAQISAALAGGESRDAVLARAGLGPMEFEALARGWAHRFAQDHALLHTFRDLVQRVSSGAPRRG